MLTTAPRGKIEMVQGILKKKKKKEREGERETEFQELIPKRSCNVMLCYVLYISHIYTRVHWGSNSIRNYLKT